MVVEYTVGADDHDGASPLRRRSRAAAAGPAVPKKSRNVGSRRTERCTSARALGAHRTKAGATRLTPPLKFVASRLGAALLNSLAQNGVGRSSVRRRRHLRRRVVAQKYAEANISLADDGLTRSLLILTSSRVIISGFRMAINLPPNYGFSVG